MGRFTINNGELTEYSGQTGYVVIPEGVTKIGDNVFMLRDEIELVSFPDGLKEIGANAFEGCSRLKKIELPDSVEKIGEGAFIRCHSLASVKLSAGLTEISGNMLGSCTELVSVEIPDGVTVIGRGAFAYCRSMESIRLSKALTEIGKEAFSGCEMLGSIDFPDGLRVIGTSAFSDCIKLKTITLPDRVTDVHYAAFYGCSGLEGVTVSEDIENLGESVFRGCTGLAHDDFIIINDILYDYCGGSDKVVVPHGVKRVSTSSFYKKEPPVREIVFPDTVMEFGAWVFNGCEHLESITLPDSITQFGKYGLMRHGQFYERIILPKEPNPEFLERLWAVTGKRKSLDRIWVAMGILEQYPDMVAQSQLWRKRMCVYKRQISFWAIDANVAAVLNALLSITARPPIWTINSWIEFGRKKLDVTAVLLEYKNSHYTQKMLDAYEKRQTDKELGLGRRTVMDWKRLFKLKDVDGGIMITRYIGDEAIVTVPSKIGRKPVVAIDELAFYDFANIISITLPDCITAIGECAFDDCDRLTLHVPRGSYAEQYAIENKLRFIAE